MPKPKLYSFQGVQMEEYCPVCKGNIENPPEIIKSGYYLGCCVKCKGDGKILTPEGKEFIHFIGNSLGREFGFVQG